MAKPSTAKSADQRVFRDIDGYERSVANAREINKAFAKVFNTDEGMALLNHLIALTINNVPPENITDAQAHRHLGKCWVVDLMVQRMALGKKGEPK